MSIENSPLDLVLAVANESKNGDSPIYIIDATAKPTAEGGNISSLHFHLVDTQKRTTLAFWKIEDGELGMLNAKFRVRARSHKWEAQVTCRFNYGSEYFEIRKHVIIPAFN